MSTLRHGQVTTERSELESLSQNATTRQDASSRNNNLFIDLNQFVMGLNAQKKFAKTPSPLRKQPVDKNS